MSGYRINIQKSLAFLNTSNERSRREIRGKIPFTITSKRIKYLGVKLLKKAKRTVLQKFKDADKEIKDDRNGWIDLTCSCIEKINIMKMTMLPKVLNL